MAFLSGCFAGITLVKRCFHVTSMDRALDNKKFLAKFFNNVLSLNYLLHLESKVSRDVWVGFFLSRVNREAGASEDVKAALQPFGRCKLTPWKMDSAVLRDRCTELPVLIRLFQFSFSSSFSPFFCGQSQCGVSPCCNELLLSRAVGSCSSAVLSIPQSTRRCVCSQHGWVPGTSMSPELQRMMGSR